MNNSLSSQRGTLRGIHYQLAPKAEDKTFRCLRGALFDVVIDLRPDSLTFLKHVAVEISAENRTMIHVPQGCANSRSQNSRAKKPRSSPRFSSSMTKTPLSAVSVNFMVSFLDYV